MRKKLVLLFILAGLVGLITAGCIPQTVIVYKAPPSLQYEPLLVCPGPAYVWIPGHWDWRPRPGRYVWIPGHCAKRPVGKVWVIGHWKRHRGGWIRVPGRWR